VWGSSAHELERMRPRIDRTSAIALTTTKLEHTRACIVQQAPFDSLGLVFSLPIELGDWPMIFLGFLGFS
jgi:hypothetical protein